MVKKQLTISIVIPNFNGAHLLTTNIPKIIQVIKISEIYKVVEIIIVDDASTDNSLEVVNKIIENYRTNEKNVKLYLYQNRSNQGFSTTANHGVSKSQSDLVLLLNTDVYPETDMFFYSVLHFHNDDNLFSVGLLDKSIENNKVVLRGRGLARWERGFLLHTKGDADSEDTFWTSGGSSIFSRKIWNKLGGFSKTYNPFYWEDIDISYRAKKSGYLIRFEPKSRVVHNHETGSILSHFSASEIKQISYRNQILFVWQNITDVSLIFSHMLWLPIHTILSMVKGDFSLFSGFVEALKLIPQVSFQRKNNIIFFKKKDKEIVSYKFSP